MVANYKVEEIIERFGPADQERIKDFFNKIKNILKTTEYGDFPSSSEESNEENWIAASDKIIFQKCKSFNYSNMMSLLNLSEECDKLESSFMRIRWIRDFNEYKKILSFIEENSVILRNLIEDIQSGVKKSYSTVVSNNLLMGKIFSYNDFIPYLEELAGEDIPYYKLVKINQEEIKNNDLFEKIRMKVLADKTGLREFLGNKEDIQKINKTLIKTQESYDLIQAEAFSKFCKKMFRFDVPFGKRIYTKKIKWDESNKGNEGQDKLFEQLFSIKKSQMGLFSVGIDIPGRNFLSKGSEVPDGNLKFEVFSPQEIIKKECFYKMKIDGKTLEISIPIYISFMRLELVKSQKTNSIGKNLLY
tara:strand:+ start:20169 stop:21248 length:1080 start_codon:yes stop_codon:yes gene_type:complete